jgi:hypothetical protein
MKVSMVKVLTKTGILNCPGSENIVFRRSVKENCLGKGKY